MQIRQCRRLWTMIVWVIPFALLSGCANIYLPQVIVGEVTGSEPLPEYPLYVLVQTAKGADGKSYNELAIVDADTWSIVRRTRLPSGYPWSIDRDPLGRIWVSYARIPGQGDNRVVVLSAEGELEKVLRPCADPHPGVHFNDEYAFATCAMNGFYAKVAIFDLDTFDMVQTIEINVGNYDFLLSSSASNETTLVLYGGGVAGNNLVTLDLASQTIQGYYPVPPANVKSMVPYGDEFFLLNIYSYEAPDETEALFVFNPTESVAVTHKELPILGPRWGTIVEDQLYSYHNHKYHSTRPSQSRFISRLDLTTGETAWWSLPDSWDADDIAWVDGKLILVHALYQDVDQVSGLYEFNLETGELAQVLHLPGAIRLLPTAP